MTAKLLFTVTTGVLLGVALTWVAVPQLMYQLLGVSSPSEALLYMGRRYSAYPFGLAVTMWLARPLLASEARRAILAGACVAMGLTAAASLYGVLSGSIGPFGWAAFGTEALLALAFGRFATIERSEASLP